MPSLQFGISSYERARGDMPGLPVVNKFAESTPVEGKVVLQSRPGLGDRSADMGPGPVAALFKRDLVLDTALFGVSAGRLYRGTTSLGSINGDGPFSIAGYENFLFAAGGASLWGYNGTTLAIIAFPDSASVIKVLVAGSRLLAIRADTGQFYWSDVLEDDIEALDFATAESQPDRLLDMLFIDGVLILFGAETVEKWPLGTGDPPFAPLQAAVIEKGIRATGCATALGSTFAWVTNEHQVCIGDENTIVSNPGLQAAIEASETCSLFTFLLDGIEFLALRLDTETHVFCGRWSVFASHGESNWLPQCFAGGVFGSSTDGKTLAWGSGHEDIGGVLERRFRAGLAINAGGLDVGPIQLRCNVGQTPFLSGDYTDPLVEMRISRDAGQTWGAWRQKPLGAQGKYRKVVRWNGNGQASQPGLLVEFRVTAPIDWRVSDVLAGEPYGGR